MFPGKFVGMSGTRVNFLTGGATVALKFNRGAAAAVGGWSGFVAHLKGGENLSWDIK